MDSCNWLLFTVCGFRRTGGAVYGTSLVDTGTPRRRGMTEPFSGREQAAAARDFAAQLRWWRSVRGYSQGRLAQRMPHSEAMIAKVESGERWPTEDLARRCDEVLQTGGAL